jgi:hypothetical protein
MEGPNHHGRFQAGGSGPLRYHALAPCRAVDTRGAAGPTGGPALSAGGSRAFALAGLCGIPATARALALNVTVAQPTAAGHLTLFTSGGSMPGTSTINYRAGRNRANNAILRLSTTGQLTVFCGQPTGTVHAILDVSGYFE